MAVILNISIKDQEKIEVSVLEECIIGRSNQSDIIINDGQASSRHGSFLINDLGQLIYKDHKSTNGSFLNGVLITQSQIQINDILRIGNTTIKIDEQKLTSEEYRKIGTSTFTNDENKTKNSKISVANDILAKVSIVSNAIDVKNKLANKTWVKGKNENIFEQEQSTGLTKLIKLVKKKK